MGEVRGRLCAIGVGPFQAPCAHPERTHPPTHLEGGNTIPVDIQKQAVRSGAARQQAAQHCEGGRVEQGGGRAAPEGQKASL